MKTFYLLLLTCFFGFNLSANTLLRKGYSSSGEVLYNWDGKNLRKGYSTSAEILINFDGKNIRKGYSSSGDILFNWDGKNFRQGYSSSGTVLYNTDAILPAAVLIYLLQ